MDRVCPLLGIAGDRRSAVDGVDAAHRCHAEDPPATLDRNVQAQLCLTAGHERCERFLRHANRTGGATPGRLSLADGLVSTRLVLAPAPAWRGIAGRPGRARRRRIFAAAGGLLAFAAGGLTLAFAVMDGRLGIATQSFEPTAAAEPPAVALATSPPTPTSTPAGTPAATFAAVPVASAPSATVTPATAPATPVAATPVPPPAPPVSASRTYIVQEGDTLALIAEQFGSTVQAIQAANGLDDADEIIIGQVLVIP